MRSTGLFLLGATIAGYGTLLGAGGGFLLVPALLTVFRTASPAAITSLSLVVVALNALSGTVAYARRARVDFRLALVLSSAAVPGTMLGATATNYVPRATFEAAFGLVLLVLAGFLFWTPAGRPRATTEPAPSVPPAPAPGDLPAGIGLSALVGTMSGLLGIGGSPLQVIVLTHAMHVPVHRAMPTSQFMVLLGAVSGVLTHLTIGDFHVGWTPLALLGGGAVLGAQVGATIAGRVSSASLVRLLAATLVPLGAHLVIAALL
jgi:hypothetical protein